MRYFLATFIGSFVSLVSSMFHFGAGATWPGEIALWIDPNILNKLARSVRKGIILVVGTNGKTTTSKMIRTVLESTHASVLVNDSGANLLNGVVSAFIQQGRLGKRYAYAIFEIDENILPIILRYIQPREIVLLNLFRDQLDRYGEVDAIIEKWITALRRLPHETTCIMNADDPGLAYIGERIAQPVRYFGLEKPALYLKTMQHATDTIYCPKCGSRLTFAGVYFSHLGKWTCGTCGLTHPDVAITASDVTSPLEGVYNIYNTMASTLACDLVGITPHDIRNALVTFRPAFGRMETLHYKGKMVRILLSKNPTGFNESIRTALSSKDHGPLLLVLNDRIPDGTDVSWIWDVDFEQLNNYEYPIILSGDRYLDLAVRMKYISINPNFKCKISNHAQSSNAERLVQDINVFINEIKSDETGWILATYSAMLDVRKILTGKKIV